MIRPGRPGDMDAITELRTSVAENHLSIKGMAALGITIDGIASSIAAGERCCFVAEARGRIVAFSMADRRDGQIFALFTRPGFEGRGYGSALLAEALGWLTAQGHEAAWLSTDPGTRAERFYRKKGWKAEGTTATGEVVLRLALKA
jgi:GNAT superfamily N-acetyltransferase